MSTPIEPNPTFADADPAQRVVVTGIGLVTPFGIGREVGWAQLKAGRRAGRWLGPESTAESPGSRAGRKVPSGSGPSPSRSGLPRRWAGAPAPPVPGPSDPVVELALTAAREAVDEAGLDFARTDRDRVGCVIGTSKGGLRSFARAFAADGGSSREDCKDDGEGAPHTRSSILDPQSAELWMQFLPNAAAAAVARTFGLQGPALCPVAACATGLISLHRGADLIRGGACDVVLAGSTDASLQEAVLGSFARLGVLARGFEDPATACRPFDRSRNGFVVGEGAAVLVMERMSHAGQRNATPVAEWLAGASAADPSGITGMDEQARGLTRLLHDVLHRAGVRAEQIDYVNLHGSATRLNDRCETRAVKRVFGPAARSLACSSIKGAIGHLLGAAGSVETAATLLAMRDGMAPPTVNLVQPDPECDLDYTAGEAQSRPIEHALKLSMGFGGHLAAAVIRRAGGTP